MEDWGSYLWYEANFWLCMAGMTLGFSLRTEGQRHVPREGPVLLLSNHQSFVDPVIVGLAARRHLYFLARQSLFRKRLLRRLIESLHAVPIHHEGFARAGLQTMLEQLQAGRAVLIFPEGERTHDGKLHALRPGIHLLIKRMAMPIVPVGIAGAYDAWPRWRAYPVPAPLFGPPGKGTIACSIGLPIDSRCFAGRPRQQVLGELFTALERCWERAEQIRRKLCALD
jgi:1-acyl-sn-glycerol-3-phosphate acyltransferase